MQLFGLHKNIYRAGKYACKALSSEEEANYRKKLLGAWDLLKTKGCTDKEAQAITGISRSTYYRRKQALSRYGIRGLEARSKRPKRVRVSSIPQSTRDLVLRLRQSHPTYGKQKVCRILARDHGVELSESSVGRILSDLFEKGLVSRYRAARRRGRKRHFKGHAKRWTSDKRSRAAGDLVQMDHMSVTKNQMGFKHFQAWDPITKTIVAECYSDATSRAAERFLEKVQRELPFPLKSIQVDGGSEFMKHFEKRCSDERIPLYVLPPKSPKLNGGVERGNRTFREDFYNQPSLANNMEEMREELDKAVTKYNTFRPHQALKGLTPLEYTQQILEVSNLSHML